MKLKFCMDKGKVNDLAQVNIKDIYPLSPMQEGMLFHSILDAKSEAYFEQTVITFNEVLDVYLVQQSLQQLMNRYDIFRTIFMYKETERPLQIVLEEREAMPVHFENISVFPEAEKREHFTDFLKAERQAGFDLEKDVPIRLALFEWSDESSRLVWSVHHIIMDGWCMGTVAQEFFTIYTSLRSGVPAQLDTVYPYSSFIQWLEQQDKEEATAYWQGYLNGLENETILPGYNRPLNPIFEAERYTCKLGKELTQGMERIAKHYHTTVSTVFQTVWGLLLQMYNHSRDVVFGSVVSGRPDEVPGIENMVGLFINTIPTRITSYADQKFSDLLISVQNSNIESTQYSYSSLADIQNHTDLKQNLVRHIVVFENYPYSEELIHAEKGPDTLQVTDVEDIVQTNYDFNVIVVPGSQYEVTFSYNRLVYVENWIRLIAAHLKRGLEQIVQQPDLLISDLEFLTTEEKSQVLSQFSGVQISYPSSDTIHLCFEKQVEKTPKTIAVVCENSSLTYAELNERANRLARTLRSCGTTTDRLVGLMTDRSIDMVVGILAILKAGGAYVPIDPSYPEERIRYIFDDSGADLLLTQSHLVEKVKEAAFGGKVLVLDEDPTIYHMEGSNLEAVSGANDLAYVIYTSGTTGQPKGVMLEHHGLCNLKTYFDETLQISPLDRALLFASYAFDAACWEIFQALFCGATLYVPTSEIILNYNQFEQYMADHKITVAALPPTYAVYLNPERMPDLRILFTAGSASSMELVTKWKDQVSYFNGYGPTENSVATSIWPVSEHPGAIDTISIGRPVPNHRVYMIDALGHLLPAGIAGELCVSGPGLARGYLHRPELTAEQFVTNPFAGGEAGYERMYRTGDLARWLPDGNIEYLGRIDHQVKIRGYRIELGEVETAMLKADRMQEVIVLAHANSQNQHELVAYYVAEREVTGSELRKQLSEELPNYMVPSHFVQMEQMPLTPNGKIDRKALPAPEQISRSTQEYRAPRTAEEQALAHVWEAVLGGGPVGLTDQFFDRGGDSIKAIQVSSRLLQAGYKLDIKDLFKYPEVAELATHLRVSDTQLADQEEVSGAVLLTPIQQWFVEQEQPVPDHFNQAVMLHREQGFEEEPLRQALTQLAVHHDALRMVFRKAEQGWEAWNRGVKEGKLYDLEVADFKDVPIGPTLGQAIESWASTIQSNIRLDEGPLLKVGLFHCADGDHLLLAIHHMVVDGVSWRILLEDLSNAYEQAVRGETIQLPTKTDSFRVWSERLSAYADSPEMESEHVYWEQLNELTAYESLKLSELLDYNKKPLTINNTATLSLKFTKEETDQLLKQAHRAYNTEVNDLLLTALGKTLSTWSGSEQVAILLEGHGREEIMKDTDISRTVGWFTSQYPVLLRINREDDISGHIKRMKEMLRSIPHKGIGYGIWRYLSQNGPSEATYAEPQISFNYLGEFDQTLQHGETRMSPYSSGADVNEQTRMPCSLDVGGIVTDEMLELDIRYNTKVLQEDNVVKLARELKQNVLEVIRHCVSRERSELTPSDVLLPGISLEALDRMVEQIQPDGELENIYPMTPMQKGMLFHNMLDSRSSAYVEQSTFELKGTLDLVAFAASLDLLVQRHSTLRTNFRSDLQDEPLQVVYRSKRGDLYVEDIREKEKAAQEQYIEEFARRDQQKGFDLAKDTLMRVSIFRTSDDSYHFVWSFHHIIMDGWCLSLVTNEVFGGYTTLTEGKPPQFPVVTPYSRYIEWLEEQNRQEAAEYWSSYLQGHEETTVLPQAKTGKAKGYEAEYLEFDLGIDLTAELQKLAKQEQVTINTLMQTAWGVLLQKYNRTEDVVFGSVVSGRPADIAGVEQMIGLFINTIPVRIQGGPATAFAELMKQTQRQALSANAYDTFPLYEIQALTEQKQDLIKHIMVFENYPVEQQVEQLGSDGQEPFTISNVVVTEQTNYDLNVVVMPGEGIKIRFMYNALSFDQTRLERLYGHFARLLEQISFNPYIRVEELEMVTTTERQQITGEFNDTASVYPRNQTIQKLFEEQAERTPDHVAVTLDHQSLTYRELNEKANRLAHTLQTAGVKADEPVGILTERSLDMIIGTLAILKVGGAYVPIDPQYPEDRIRYMLEDSGAKLLLTQQDLLDRCYFDGQIVNLNDDTSYSSDASNLGIDGAGEHAAYVIYTSGSTGKPKGVVVEHQSVVRLVRNTDYVPFDESIRMLQTCAFVFDVSTFEIWGALLNGGQLVLVHKDDLLDAAKLKETIRDHRITMMWLTTPLFNQLSQQDSKLFGDVKYLLVGGDVLSAPHINRVLRDNPDMNIINGYGPTENTTFSTAYHIKEEQLDSVPIGRPIRNSTAYVVDSAFNLQPIGAWGELVVGGDGVARGYLNRPELTAERFLANPWVDGDRLYRTGDLVRWREDGTLEYAGRMDQQVKIRGYRIELGEVESAMLKIDRIQEVSVLAHATIQNQHELVAYYVAEQEVTGSELRKQLSEELPNYMVPSYFVQMQQMPLTPNGKIDRKALPAPEQISRSTQEYRAPQTAEEQALAHVWEAVLGGGPVGLTDQFFDRGGDSIKAIQVSSRLLQAGYKLDIKDLFKYPEVAELATHLRVSDTQLADQEEVSGAVLLTPIQQWFVEQGQPVPDHFNQAVMLHREQGFEEEPLRQALTQLVVHHDALRMVFRKAEQGWEAWNRRAEEGALYDLEVADFKDVPIGPVLGQVIEARASTIQSSIRLDEGPLPVSLDGVSWRILLEDLSNAYEQAVRGEAIQLPAKTDSFRVWSERLSAYADSPEMESEHAYWEQVNELAVSESPQLPVSQEHSDRFMQQDMGIVNVRLTKEETDQLLKQAHRAYNTEVNDLLLTGLGKTLSAWTGNEKVAILLEGHGREEILKDTDISRTIGWFTSQYPVLLRINREDDISGHIKRMKEMLRSIPRKGIGYGIWRYLSQNGPSGATYAEPQISFNYLGEFDQTLQHSGMHFSPYSSGASTHELTQMSCVMDVGGLVTDGMLELSIQYNIKALQQNAAEQLAEQFKQNVLEVVQHCASREQSELTPSDVLLSDLSLEELNRMVEQIQSDEELENMYPMTPMQKGMLFHNMLDFQSSAYVEQSTFELKGTLDLTAFAASLDLLVKRHSALRTNFRSDLQDQPLQVVYRNKRGELYVEDIREKEKTAQEQYIEEFTRRDQQRGFDLAKDALMRVSILRTSDDSYHFVWSFHHIIMDGWCLSLVTNEVFGGYTALTEGKPPQLPVVTPYSRYIEWLERQNRQEAAEYWSGYLWGYEETAVLPQAKTGKTQGYEAEYLEFDLGIDLTRALLQLAKQEQVTINTLMQTAWGVLLQKYNRTEDVVFGSVVSGRPADIAGVEQMIGLFINTVPVRIQGGQATAFTELMKQTQRQALASGTYETFPLYEIQAQAEQKVELINHIMVFENYPMDEQIEQLGEREEADFKITGVDAVEQTNYDFNIVVLPGETLRVHFGYNAQVYDYERVEQIQGHLLQLLEQIKVNPAGRICELDILTAQEREQMLGAWCDTTAAYPREQTIHGLFEEQVMQTPEQAAVYFEGAQVTYRELNERANRLARTLRSNGVMADGLVGLMTERSIDMIVGILGILKAGGAYIPVDPTYPENRIRYMLDDSGTELLLTQQHLVEKVEFRGKVLLLDAEMDEATVDASSAEAKGNPVSVYHRDGTNLEAISGPHNLAYVIYTSGTTGQPKGVMLEHRGLCNLHTYFRETLRISGSDRVVSFASYSFDASIWEMLQALFNGATLCIPTSETILSYDKFEQYMADHRITITILPPTYAVYLNPERMPDLRILFTGGSAASPELVSKWKDHVTYYNAYGPTENSITTSIWLSPEGPEAGMCISIGRPVPNHRVYMVDAHGQLSPSGIPGELCVSGPGLARGYLHRPELTADQFVTNPFADGEAGYERMYRTGDLARWMPDGNIEYLGRIDQQVKIRGYRIELGEVEAAMLKADRMQEVIVLAHANSQNQHELVAYYVAEREVTGSELRKMLNEELPNYMVPSHFIQLQNVPLTPNGKIDRKALPIPEGRLADHVAPRTWMEIKLVDIWQDVLGLQQVGINENFFEIGGHSLRATTLTSRVRKDLNKPMDLQNIFEAPTIEKLAALLEEQDQITYASIPVTEKRDTYPLSFAQTRMYVLHQLDPDGISYNTTSALRVIGPIDMKQVEEAFHQLISRHVALRTSFELINGVPMQRVHDTIHFELEYATISELRTESNELMLENLAEEHARSFVRPFDLRIAPLLRVKLVKWGLDEEGQEPQHLLMLDMHHIVSDGVSIEILAGDFARLYSGEVLSPLRIQYTDYAVWQHSKTQQERIKSQGEYWLNRFSGDLPQLDLPTDFERPATRCTKGDAVEFEMGLELTQRLKELAVHTDSTLYMVLMAAYTALLHYYTGQEDIIVGTPIAGRPHADLEPMLGMFVGTLALRNHPHAEQTFYNCIEDAKTCALQAYAHQDYPFEELVEKLDLKRDMSRNPLFDTMFVLQNVEKKEVKLDKLFFRSFDIDQVSAKFDLTLEVNEEEASIQLQFLYATSLFKRETVESMARHFVQLVKTVVANPNTKLGELTLISEEDKGILKKHRDILKASRYWSTLLEGYEEAPQLPYANLMGRSPYQTEHLEINLDVERTVALQRIALNEQVTTNTLLQTAWGILLQKYNGTDDVVFACSISSPLTDKLDSKHSIGLGNHTLPVRIRTEAGANFIGLMRSVQQQTDESAVYEHLPMSELVTTKVQQLALFGHRMVFETTLEEANTEQESYDLSIIVLQGDTLRIDFSYNAQVYDHQSVSQIQGHLLRLLDQIIANPDSLIEAMDLLTKHEREHIIQVWGNTTAEYSREQTIHGLFEEQVLQTSDQTAVYFEGQQLTYHELNERANRLARTLRSYGVKADSLVSLMTERSVDMIVGILGILKAGGAYIPIDPTYPEERIRYMLDDSGTELLLTQQHLTEKVLFGGKVLVLDGEQDGVASDTRKADVRREMLPVYHQNGSNLEAVSGPNDLAYVIYTSGTTGQPKGVMLEHHGLSNLKTYFEQKLSIGLSDRVVMFASYSFDTSCSEIIQSLLCGATLYIPSSETILNYERFEQYMAACRITIATLPPNYAVYLNPDRMPDLRVLLTAGSASTAELVSKWKDRVAYYNAYGPTENSVATSLWPVSEENSESGGIISIGRPVSNHRVYMVDTHGNLSPAGVPGELCVSGPGLARGYLHRPELTKEKFVANLFAAEEVGYERMYRTGDLARWLPDGNIEYLGRIDHQVKIRGYRIELGEIEAQIIKVDGVKESIVMARADQQGDYHLAAYYVAEKEISGSMMLNLLNEKLPNYMIPSYFIQLQNMPLTPNGKIDRKALPAPEDSLQSRADYVAPRTWVEVKLAQIWQDVLGLEQVGVKENFFEIGGHSLRATTLASKIHKELNKLLPLRSIFEAPTIEQLAAIIEGLDQVAYASIPVTEERSFYPLSSAQKRLYVLHQFDPNDVNYNMPSVLQMSGPLDVKQVEDAFHQLITRHATLRTRFELVDNEPMQWVEDTVSFEVEYTKVQAERATTDTDQDTATATDTTVSQEAQELVRQFVRPFDLKAVPLLRVGLVDLGVQGVEQESQHLLMLDMHHIVSDGVSMEVLTDEFVRLYSGEELLPLRIQYKDYAVWQQSEAHQEWMQRQEAYWLDTFRGGVPALDLSTDFARPAVQSTAGDTIEFGLEREVSERLKELAAQTGATLYMVLLAAYTTLLHKYTGQEDIVVGTPIAGRPHAELESLVGVFINTLAIRNYPSGDKTFLDYLQEVKEHALSAYEHQDYPFEELVEKLNLTRDTSRNALFDTMFELKTLEQQEFHLEGLTLHSYPLENNTAKFDLTLDAVEQPDGIVCSLEYSTALYKPETITRLAQHFTELVRAITLHPQQPLAALEMVPAEEKAQIIHGFGNVGVSDVAAVEAEALFHTFVEEQAQLVPDHVAVVYEEQQLTYRKLNERANQLARRLRNEGIGRESIVGILSERSVDMLVGVLAVWKAGGAYVPLDADYPSERIHFMLEDSGATVLLTQTGLQDRAQAWLEESRQALAGGQSEAELETAAGAETMESGTLHGTLNGTATSSPDSEAASELATRLRLQSMLALDDESLYIGDITDVDHINEPQDLAYVIYTSGTTGRPKGVMIEHRSLVNTAAAYRRDYRLSEFPVRLLQLASFSFDVFVGDIARTLYNGGTMVICPKDDRIDFSRLYGWIRDYQITVFESTPALIVPFMQHVHEQGLDMSSLELLITSSDSCSVTDYRVLQERFGADIRIMNSYGVTEAAIDSSFYDEELSKLPSSGNVPIGQAWLNARFYIVDSQLNPVPIGVLGELCIGGAGVARGYLNRADLTAEKFVANPYVPGERLYRTGDLARWMPDGNVDFIGRMDDQVKIRGFRIELGEVEAQLLTVDGIQKAIVTAWEDEDGDKDLCAYVVASEALNLPELRNLLQPKLPGYMIPTYVVQLDHFPLTPNGKIDRKALPAPDGDIQTGVEYAAPRTDMERHMVDIWKQNLGVSIVGIDDNYFNLGGHSLKAIQLVSQAKAVGIEIGINQVFQYQTIRQMSEYMRADTSMPDILTRDIAEAIDIIEKAYDVYAHFQSTTVEGRDQLTLHIDPFDSVQAEALKKVILSRLHPDLHPHHLLPFEEAVQVLGCEKLYTDTMVDDEAVKLHAEEWLEHLLRMNDQWNSTMLAGEPLQRYALAPAQHYHLEHPQPSGGVVPFDSYLLDVERLSAVMQRLIERHELFRSVLVQTDIGCEWETLSMKERMDIPMIDLSNYDAEMQNRILSHILPAFFMNPYETTGDLLYRIALVRLNLRDHLLLLPCSHLIYDNMSGEVVKSELYRAYDDINNVKGQLAGSYRDYVSQVRKGPQGMGDQEIVDKFRLSAFATASDAIFLAVDGRSYTTGTDVTVELANWNDSDAVEYMWDLAIRLANRFFRRYLQVDEVPVLLVNYGRAYEDKQYFDIIGEFIDQIPVLLTDADEQGDEIRKTIQLAVSHNLNFLNLIYNGEMTSLYPQSNRYLKHSLNKLPIVFNYLGEASETYQLFKNVLPEERDFHRDSIIFFTVQHLENVLQISLELPFEENPETVKAMLETELANLLVTDGSGVMFT
ncbi:non-ribosomal peptide synthase/polyketide synthase [Paenibacillus sp. cl130]|nr:non-ribosomal peptide synthase/polyketide synthase [Paenibacillus sp. cl130]SFR11785.1 non-ribosomal peptide synthase domain TIGR01720/amino acid adenylation domain-containing protein [Paenibacillus sp. cl130]